MTVPSAEQVHGELANAFEALDDAESTLKEDRLRTAISRAYYAVFHAARAVLWSKGFGPKTHKGVIQLFSKEIVNARLVGKPIGKILSDAHDERELADYHSLVGEFEHREVQNLVQDARRFVEEIERLL